MRRQLRALGLGHDPRRGVATTDVHYYRWTQWIFLRIFNAWYDDDADRARPIDELVAELDAGTRPPVSDANPEGRPWSELDDRTRRRVVDSYRLAYREEALVNWCPALGTVLANEEVTAEGRSDRGNHPVFKRPLEQWMLRITKYADRLLADLDRIDWPEPIKVMQRNWIGRSTGASIRFPVEAHEGLDIEVFTTRPDTIFGATYLVLAPEHPLVDRLVPTDWPGAVLADETAAIPAAWRGVFGADVTPAEAIVRYREFVERRTELERQAEGREKTGVFTGAFAENPATGGLIPVFVADYVLMGYGTGAIMAVPGEDQRDWDFATEFDLPIVRTVQPPAGFDGDAYTGDGPAMNSEFLDGLPIDAAKRRIIDWLETNNVGTGTVTYKLRDWLFSRQRYWGEPFPIVYGEDGLPVALPDSMLPVELPDLEEFEPVVTDDAADTPPEPPLARAEHWVEVTLDLGDGPRRYRRETNTMPQWAGSCWYYLRYLDPTNENRLVDPDVERYWMTGDGGGGVDLYVGGVEHAVLHLLYARFWHKILFDLGFVSTLEPFHRLFNQGYIQAPAFQDARGLYVEASEVVERDGQPTFHGEPVTREFGKMGKSLKNAVTPDDVYRDYGADTLRLYEMFMGPLDASRPWSTNDIVGVHRFLQRLWRNVIDEETDVVRVADAPADPETRRLLHRTIAAVGADMAAPVAAWIGSISVHVWHPSFVFLAFLFLVFPDGRLLSSRWRPLAWVAAATAVAGLVTGMLESTFLTDSENLPFVRPPITTANAVAAPVFDAFLAANGAVLLASAAAFVLRFRRAGGEERLQLRWLAYAVSITVLALPVSLLLIGDGRGFAVAATLVPAAAAVAILRYRLYDIDVIVRRSLVYGALTLFVLFVYAGVAALAQTISSDRLRLALAAPAAALVAVALVPVRDVVQRCIVRLLYGERDEPYAVLARLSRRLEAAIAPEDVLPVIVETVAAALKLPYVAIEIADGAGLRLAAAHGRPARHSTRIPLQYRSATVGELVLALRAGETEFARGDRRLLDDLARQAGIAVHAVALTSALQRSRERLVTAREEERRRLRRDLHDGLGPMLAALVLKLDVVSAEVATDPAAASAKLSQLRDERHSR